MPRTRTFVVSLAALLALVGACKPRNGGTKKPEGDVASGVKELAAGENYTAALFNDGHVRAVGPTESKPRVLELSGKVTHIVGGKDHGCVQLESGTAHCLGHNTWGGLGTDDPDDLEWKEHKLVQLSAGHGYSCAVLDDQTVHCWGTAQGGRLGYGNRDDVRAAKDAGPVAVGGPVRSIHTGSLGVTCAVLVAGTVRCWGQNVQGVLGYGNALDVGVTNTPESVGDVALPGKVVDVAIGGVHVCALLEGGHVRCWGFNSEGRLGYMPPGNIGDDETPMAAQDVDIGAPVTALAAGNAHTCALLDTGAVRCWGAGHQGQLGYGDTKGIGADGRSPAQAGDVPIGGKAKQLVAGPTHTCVLLESGEVECWGTGYDGVGSSPTPVKVVFATRDKD